jgi:hypothetical protein
MFEKGAEFVPRPYGKPTHSILNISREKLLGLSFTDWAGGKFFGQGQDKKGHFPLRRQSVLTLTVGIGLALQTRNVCRNSPFLALFPATFLKISQLSLLVVSCQLSVCQKMQD